MVGAGHQSAFQLRAAAAQRDFKKVVAWNRSPEKLQQLETVAVGLGLEFESVSSAQLAANADVIITITLGVWAVAGRCRHSAGDAYRLHGNRYEGKAGN